MSIPEKLYKFGTTSFPDVLQRFDIQQHIQNNWRATPLAQDYNIRVLWSKWVTQKEAKEAEKWFKQSYPKTFICEVDYNGITECRDWDRKQSYAFFQSLQNRFPDKEKDAKATHKIYYVMLTKKQA
jgi:hypothetical protein